MRTSRLLLLAAAVTGVVIAACSGGSSSSTPPVVSIPSGGGVTPTTTPSGSHPDSNADSFVFTGKLTTTTTYNYPTAAPTFSPGNEPPLNSTAAVTQTVTVESTVCPTPENNVTYTCSGSPQNYVDFHDAETDAYGVETNDVTTDSWFNIGTSQWLLYGTIFNDGAGDTYYTSYSPAYQVDVAQETGPATWNNNSVGDELDVLDTDGTPTEQNFSSSGAYVETQELVGGYYIGITVSSNGSGTYGGGVPFSSGLGAGANNLTTNASNSFAAWDRHYGLSYSTPGENITITEIASPSPTATPSPTYTGEGTAPPSATPRPTAAPATVATPSTWYTTPLHTDSGALTIGVEFPEQCDVPDTFGDSGNEIVETTYIADPVMGFTENQTITTYVVNGLGPVCVELNDTQDNYYDFNSEFSRGGTSGTSFSSFFQGNAGSPMSVETISETLTLQSATGLGIASSATARKAQSTSRSTSSSTSASSSLNPLVVDAVTARFQTLAKQERLRRERAFSSALQRIAIGGNQ